MNKIIYEITTKAGDIFEIRSSLMSRSIFGWFQQLPTQDLKDFKKGSKAILEFAKVVGAEWKLQNEDDTKWRKNNWDDLPPSVVNRWIEQLIVDSADVTAIQVKSEKK